jgi:thiamine monophosphate synthase
MPLTPIAPKLPSPLLAIADAGYLGEGLVESVRAAHRGGIEWVLLRGKELSAIKRGALAQELQKLCPGLVLSVHSGPEVEGAWGQHLASTELHTYSDSSAHLPVGYSCHDAEELSLAKRAGAAYCLLSPVGAPTSKESYLKPLGWSGFEELAKGSSLPLYALGGMKPEMVAEAIRAGAAGVAVLGDLFGSSDVEARAALWMRAVRASFNQ